MTAIEHIPTTTIHIKFLVKIAINVVGIAAKQYSMLKTGNSPCLAIKRFCTKRAVKIHKGT